MGRRIRKERKSTRSSAVSPQALKAISEISQAITSHLYLTDILRLIVTVTAEIMNSKICSLMLLDESRSELVVRATQSISPLYNKKPNIKLGEGIAGLVAKENRPIIAHNVKKDQRYLNRDIAKTENLCSLLSVPLSIKDKAIGVINLYTSKPRKFSDAEVKVLTTVANQAAVAIEHARVIVESSIIKEELATRKVVERAKGILMRQEGLSEEDAFRKIQKTSMDTRRSMREIADAIVLTSQLKR
ncbi:MAG: GAF and ANTAR domain-containing protein [Candidatus Omnitrophica bacterium]|nr:GAF and ANTAR domain-containing protein [Candidatus Omnitrophota bacterium]